MRKVKRVADEAAHSRHMASVEELRAQLQEAEAALAADPNDAELRQLTVELKTLIQSAIVEEGASADEGRYA